MEPMEYKLNRPVEFCGRMIDTLTLKNEVTVDDVEDGYDELDMIRASKERPSLAKKEMNQTELMKLMVSRGTGHPVEVMGLLSYKDLIGAFNTFSDFLL